MGFIKYYILYLREEIKKYYFLSFYMTFQNNVQKVKKIDFLAFVSQSLHSRTF